MKQTITTLWLFFAISQLLQSQSNSEIWLPVRMASMQAARINQNQAYIKWQVICRVSFAKFEVQKSRDGVNFETIHTFQADKIRCQSPFDYVDQAASGAGFYRIRVGDIDGQFTAEKLIFVNGIKLQNTRILVTNPIQNEQIQVQADIQQKQTLHFLLIDPTGRRVLQQRMEFDEGTIRFNWLPPVQWVKGYYYLIIRGTNYRQEIKLLKL